MTPEGSPVPNTLPGTSCSVLTDTWGTLRIHIQPVHANHAEGICLCPHHVTLHRKVVSETCGAPYI